MLNVGIDLVFGLMRLLIFGHSCFVAEFVKIPTWGCLELALAYFSSPLADSI